MTPLPGRCQSCDARVVLVENRWLDAETRRPHKCKASTSRLAAFMAAGTLAWVLLALHW